MNKKKAIEIVMEYEKKQGRNPEKINKFKTGCDLKSGDRFIDIKTNEKKNKDILISFSNFKKLGRNISNYYIYYLMGDEKPKLKVLNPEFILRNFNLLTLINIKINSIKDIEEIVL